MRIRRERKRLIRTIVWAAVSVPLAYLAMQLVARLAPGLWLWPAFAFLAWTAIAALVILAYTLELVVLAFASQSHQVGTPNDELDTERRDDVSV